MRDATKNNNIKQDCFELKLHIHHGSAAGFKQADVTAFLTRA